MNLETAEIKGPLVAAGGHGNGDDESRAKKRPKPQKALH